MSPRGGYRPGGGRPSTGPKTTTSLRVPDALLAQIRDAAGNEGLTVTEWLLRAARKALPRARKKR